MARHFTLHKVPATGGAPAAAFKLAQRETAHRWPWFLPDGHHFLYLAFGQPGTPRQLRVGSLDGTSTLFGPSDSEAPSIPAGTCSSWAADSWLRTASTSPRGGPRERASLSIPSRTYGHPNGPDGYAWMSVSSSGVLATSRGVFQRISA